MAITVTITPAAPIAVESACRIDVAGSAPNTTSGYAENTESPYGGQYPTEPELRQYLAFMLGGVEQGRSYVFAVSADGDHTFNNYTFPEAGSWTVELRNASGDGVLKSQAVSVS